MLGNDGGVDFNLEPAIWEIFQVLITKTMESLHWLIDIFYCKLLHPLKILNIVVYY